MIDSATTPLLILANDPPVIEVERSSPEVLITLMPTSVQMGAKPGSIYVLGLSSDAIPSLKARVRLPFLASLEESV